MARRKPNAPPKATRQPAKQKFSSAERSSLYASREAAKVLGTVLRGDSERRAVASIKSLVFSPSVRNKRGTFALVCETLKRNVNNFFLLSLSLSLWYSDSNWYVFVLSCRQILL